MRWLTTRWTPCIRRMSWVPQEPFLFSASVAENIGLAKADATRDEIEHAARLACIDDDIPSHATRL
jgi:ABC-type multidrug transport system fused ATPase/permease subunit